MSGSPSASDSNVQRCFEVEIPSTLKLGLVEYRGCTNCVSTEVAHLLGEGLHGQLAASNVHHQRRDVDRGTIGTPRRGLNLRFASGFAGTVRFPELRLALADREVERRHRLVLCVEHQLEAVPQQRSQH
jgi:hypothetical protein